MSSTQYALILVSKPLLHPHRHPLEKKAYAGITLSLYRYFPCIPFREAQEWSLILLSLRHHRPTLPSYFSGSEYATKTAFCACVIQPCSTNSCLPCLVYHSALRSFGHCHRPASLAEAWKALGLTVKLTGTSLSRGNPKLDDLCSWQ